MHAHSDVFARVLRCDLPVSLLRPLHSAWASLSALRELGLFVDAPLAAIAPLPNNGAPFTTLRVVRQSPAAPPLARDTLRDVVQALHGEFGSPLQRLILCNMPHAPVEAFRGLARAVAAESGCIVPHAATGRWWWNPESDRTFVV